jgi:hypothetical protein
MGVEKKLDAQGKPFWVDLESGREFALVVAGLAWPRIREGYIVVAGVAAFEDHSIEHYPIYLLAEASSLDFSKLLTSALQMKDRFSLDRIYADCDPTMSELLGNANRDRAARSLKPLGLTEPIYSEKVNKISYCLELVKKLANPSRKILYFGPESSIPMQLPNITTEAATMARPGDFPAIEALANCLIPLLAWRPRMPSSPKVESDFDPLKD